jgi:hypothetical protein
MVRAAKVCGRTFKPPDRLIKSLFRPYLHMYSHSDELEEVGIISLTGVKIENDPEMERLFGVSK